MSVTLYFGVRLSGRPYKRIPYKLNDETFSTISVENLKQIIAEVLLDNYPNQHGLELVYCGSVLDDSAEVKKEGIRPGCTIHVFEKSHLSEPKSIVLTQDNIKIAVKAYSRILSYTPENTFPNIISPEALSKILVEYPELYNDIGAFGIIKDPILLVKMLRTENARIMGEQYPVLVYGSKFIADTIIDQLKKNPRSLHETVSSDIDMMSEEESVEDQRVTRNQLAAALLSASAGAAGSHSSPLSIQSTNYGQQYQQYFNELTTMREMGFTNENNNLQALIMCNGNVAVAVIFVMSTGNFS